MRLKIIFLWAALVISSCEKEALILPTVPLHGSSDTALINNEKQGMTGAQESANSGTLQTPKRKRPGVHAKSRVVATKGKTGWKKHRGQAR